MTAKERAAAAYRKIAEGYIELADINSEAAHGVADDLPPLLPMKDPGEIGTERIDRVPDVAMAPPAEGSLSQCPVHHKPYRDGKYGMFCKQSRGGRRLEQEGPQLVLDHAAEVDDVPAQVKAAA